MASTDPKGAEQTPHPTALELLVGFEMGLVTRAQVGAWVNVEVERHDVLPDALLELTLLRGKDEVDIANLIRALVPERSAEARARLVLGVLAELVRAGRVPIKRALNWAPQIANEISLDAYFEAAGLEDMHDLAEAGTYGTVADAEREFLAFLERRGENGAPPPDTR